MKQAKKCWKELSDSMEYIKEPPEQMEIVVDVGPVLVRFATLEETEGAVFKNYLLQYIQELLTALAIPTDISLVIRGNEDEQKFAWSSYRVMINGQRCRLPLPTIMPQNVTALELARSVARVVYWNRSLCMTSALAEKILHQWSFTNDHYQEDLKDLQLREIHTFFSQLVRYGFKLDRGKEAIQTFRKKEQRGWKAANLFEDTVTSWDVLMINVSLNETLYTMLLGKGANEEDTKVQTQGNDQRIEAIFTEIQDVYYRDRGVLLPKIGVILDKSLEGHAFRIQLNDLHFPPIRALEQDQYLVYAGTVATLASIGVNSEHAINPSTNREWAIIRGSQDAEKVRNETNLGIWGSEFLVLQCVMDEIMRNTSAFLHTDALKYNLNLLQPTFPVLIDAVFQRFDMVALLQILKNLAEEELSILDLVSLFETLVGINGTINFDKSSPIVFSPTTANFCFVKGEKNLADLDAIDFVNYLRTVFFKEYILFSAMKGRRALLAYQLDPQLEERIRNIVEQPLQDNEYDQLMETILNEMQQLPPEDPDPVILTPYDLRKSVAGLIEKEFPWLMVLSYQELQADTEVRVLAQIPSR
jgi:hypothetical protein